MTLTVKDLRVEDGPVVVLDGIKYSVFHRYGRLKKGDCISGIVSIRQDTLFTSADGCIVHVKRNPEFIQRFLSRHIIKPFGNPQDWLNGLLKRKDLTKMELLMRESWIDESIVRPLRLFGVKCDIKTRIDVTPNILDLIVDNPSEYLPLDDASRVSGCFGISSPPPLSPETVTSFPSFAEMFPWMRERGDVVVTQSASMVESLKREGINAIVANRFTTQLISSWRKQLRIIVLVTGMIEPSVVVDRSSIFFNTVACSHDYKIVFTDSSGEGTLLTDDTKLHELRGKRFERIITNLDPRRLQLIEAEEFVRC